MMSGGASSATSSKAVLFGQKLFELLVLAWSLPVALRALVNATRHPITVPGQDVSEEDRKMMSRITQEMEDDVIDVEVEHEGKNPRFDSGPGATLMNQRDLRCKDVETAAMEACQAVVPTTVPAFTIAQQERTALMSWENVETGLQDPSLGVSIEEQWDAEEALHVGVALSVRVNRWEGEHQVGQGGWNPFRGTKN